MLYAWCRHCDDVIDGQDLGHGMETPDAASARQRLTALYAKTRAALAGEPTDDPDFAAFQRVALRRHIPERYAIELIDGFAMDVAARRYETLEDTLDYCWHVAGVVGVMMALVMGIEPDDLPTLRRAQDLGLAFQLTNISRDVIEDAQNSRIYLPAAWLEAARPACRKPRSGLRRSAPRRPVVRRQVQAACCWQRRRALLRLRKSPAFPSTVPLAPGPSLRPAASIARSASSRSPPAAPVRGIGGCR